MNTDPSTRHPRLAELFGIDLRSLALLRFSLGLVLIALLLQLLPDLRALYSDAGMMPRIAVLAAGEPYRLSLHLIQGSTLFVLALWALQLVAALMLTLGWHTRFAAVASFLLYASLMNRSPAVASATDAWLLALLLWLCFLPAGARYAVDAAARPQAAPRPACHLSWGSAGLLVQVAVMFLLPALVQGGVEWREDHSALWYALSIDADASWLGQRLLDSQQLLANLTAAIWWIAVAAPLLAFAPLGTRPLRAMALLALISVPLSLLLLFAAGTLPALQLCALAVFVGPGLWERLARAHERRRPIAPRLFHDRNGAGSVFAGRLLQQFLILPRLTIEPAQDNPRARALLEANDSWVVIDSEERAHLRWAGFAALLRHSPLFWPLASLAARPRVNAVGDRVYDWLARCGPHGAAPTRTLPGAPHRGLQALTVGVCLLMLGAALASLPQAPPLLGRIIAPPLQALHLDPQWMHWLPAAARDDSWIVVAARAADGREIDLLDPAHAAPDYTRRNTAAAGGARWRLLQQRLGQAAYARYLPQYARQLCQRWTQHEPQRPLGSFRILHMLERTPSPGGARSPLEQQVLWRQDCPVAVTP